MLSDLSGVRALLLGQALQQERTYMGTLATSMALMLEEFYRSLHAVGVSAVTGARRLAHRTASAALV